MYHMQIPPEQGQFLAFLIKLIGPDMPGDRSVHRLWKHLDSDGPLLMENLSHATLIMIGRLLRKILQKAGVENKIELDWIS